MIWLILTLVGGLAILTAIGALLSRAWGRGSHTGMSERMETEGNLINQIRGRLF